MPRLPPRPKTKPGVEAVLRKHRGGQHYWSYRVRWTDPLTGRRLGDYFATQAEALDFKEELRRARRRGSLGDLDRGSILLHDFAGQWLEEWGARNLAKRTLERYVGSYNGHLAARIGHLQLRQINPRVVAELRNDLADDGRSPTVILKALTVLGSMLTVAVEWGELNANPVRSVRKPVAVRTKVITPLTVLEVETLCTHLPDPDQRMLVRLLAYGAARPQDALALPWTEVGDQRLVYAWKNVEGEIVPGAKTGADKSRSVIMLRALRADLVAHRLAQPARTKLVVARAGRAWTGADYKNWTNKAPRGARRADGQRAGSPAPFARAAAAAGLPDVTPYFLRHTYASLRIAEQRLSLQEIADELGHAVPTLLAEYVHVISEYRGLGAIDPDALILSARETLRETDDRPQHAPSTHSGADLNRTRGA